MMPPYERGPIPVMLPHTEMEWMKLRIACGGFRGYARSLAYRTARAFDAHVFLPNDVALQGVRELNAAMARIRGLVD